MYVIKQGNHYSSLSWQRLWFGWGTNKLQFSSAFMSDPCYKFGNEDDNDVNKLYGLIFGLDPHKFSYRIGWNSTGDKTVGYYHYYYVNGQRFIKPIGSYPSNLKINWCILISRESNGLYLMYKIGNNVQMETVDFNFTNAPMITRKLFPYFGGNQVSIKETKIDIVEYSGAFY